MTWNSFCFNAVDNLHIWQQKNWARCTIASVRAAGAFSVLGKAMSSRQSPLYNELVCGLLNEKETNNWVLWKNGFPEVSA